MLGEPIIQTSGAYPYGTDEEGNELIRDLTQANQVLVRWVMGDNFQVAVPVDRRLYYTDREGAIAAARAVAESHLADG